MAARRQDPRATRRAADASCSSSSCSSCPRNACASGGWPARRDPRVPNFIESVRGGVLLVVVALGGLLPAFGRRTSCGPDRGSRLAIVMLSLVVLTGYGGPGVARADDFRRHRRVRDGPLRRRRQPAWVPDGAAARSAPRARSSRCPRCVCRACISRSRRWRSAFSPKRCSSRGRGCSAAARAKFRGSTSSVSPSPVSRRSSSCWPWPSRILAVFVLTLRRGRFGRFVSAMRDSPSACTTLGVNLTTTKLGVFAFSAAMAGFAGAFYGGLAR